MDECIEVPTCDKKEFPIPDDSKLFKPLSQSLYIEGEFVNFECNDPNAVLDDSSGRNFFPLECRGEDLVGYYENVLVPVVEEANETVIANQTVDGNVMTVVEFRSVAGEIQYIF